MTIAALLLTAVVSGGLIYGEMQKHTRHEFQDEYKNYQKVVKDNNLDSLSTRDIIEDLFDLIILNSHPGASKLTDKCNGGYDVSDPEGWGVFFNIGPCGNYEHTKVKQAEQKRPCNYV